MRLKIFILILFTTTSIYSQPLSREERKEFDQFRRGSTGRNYYIDLADYGFQIWKERGANPCKFFKLALSHKNQKSIALPILLYLNETNDKSLTRGTDYCKRTVFATKDPELIYLYVNVKLRQLYSSTTDGWSREHDKLWSLLQISLKAGHKGAEALVAKENIANKVNVVHEIGILEKLAEEGNQEAAFCLGEYYVRRYKENYEDKEKNDLVKAGKLFTKVLRMNERSSPTYYKYAMLIAEADKDYKHSKQLEEIFRLGLLAGHEDSTFNLIRLFSGLDNYPSQGTKLKAYMSYYLENLSPLPKSKLKTKQHKKAYARYKNIEKKCKKIILPLHSQIEQLITLSELYCSDPKPLTGSYLEGQNIDAEDKVKKLQSQILKLLNNTAASPKVTSRRAKYYLLGECDSKVKEQTALNMYKKAASRKQADACYVLAQIYYYGYESIKSDHRTSLYWYKKGMSFGDPLCTLGVARFYYNGDSGVEKDKSKALELFTESRQMLKTLVSEGNTDLCNHPGLVFDINSNTVPNNYTEAFALTVAEFEWDEVDDIAN